MGFGRFSRFSVGAVSAALLGCAALGGGAGAVLRFALDAAIKRRWSRPFPLSTFVINVLGSLLLGLIVGVAGRGAGPLVTLLGTGVLGGFTTFSTASHETVRLARAGDRRTAALYGFGSLLGAAAAAWMGIAVGMQL